MVTDVAKKHIGEPAYLVLAALANGERHGYGIVGEVAEITDGQVRLGTGTLYGVLDRLVADGQVAPGRDEVVDGRLRRYYRITGAGRQVLTEELERQESAARAVRIRLAGAS
jgi:DNA-binding PadR family transcriptional regulator